MAKIGFVCCVKEGYDCLEGLINKGFSIDFIMTFTKDCADKYSGAVSYDKLASDEGIPLYKVESINSLETAVMLKNLSPDVLFIIGWSEIVKKHILEIPRMGVIGFHASMLPHYRGPAPVNWAIIKGEKQTGNTMFWMSPGIDTGNIIDQRGIKINKNDTCATIYKKVSMTEVKMVIDNIDNLMNGGMPGKAQTTILPKLKRRFPEDGLMRWENKAGEMHDFIRGVTRPYPGAFTFFRKKKLFFWKSAYKDEDFTANRNSKYKPGTVLDITPEGIKVACSEGELVLKELQFEDEKALSGAAFAEQYGIRKGNILRDDPEKVAVFVSHFDDEVLGIGGTLIEHFKRGDEIHIYIVCESSSVRYSEQDIPLQSYARDASYYLGASSLTCFEYPDQRLDTIPLIELTQKVEGELEKIRPDYVYTHFAGDLNEDHKVVNKAVVTACRSYNADYIKMLAVFETPSSTEWGDFQEGVSAFYPNCFIDISGSLGRKMYAMRCYKSEVRKNNHPRSIEALKNKAQYWGSVCNKEYAEPLLIVRLVDPLGNNV
jgi:methionyl-tRNA formyltransferase/LmbE family N-acetylglucosaminyl deacetylase